MSSPLADLDAQYDKLDRRAIRHQNIHVRSRATIMVVGVITIAVQTLRMGFVELLGLGDTYAIAGLTFTGDRALEVVASSLSGLTAAITALAGVVNAPRIWVAARTGAEALKAEAFLFATSAGRYRGDRDEAALRARMLEIEGIVNELEGKETGGGR